MSTTDQQVLASDAKALEGQGSLSVSNILGTLQPQPNPIGLGLTQLSPEMESFYAIVSIPNSKFGMMVEADYMSPGDLVYLDESVINQLSIRLSSKAQLKSYIK